MNDKNIWTVSEINRHVRAWLMQDEVLKKVCVQGEISNFKNHSSGHWYFSLKDSTGVLKAIMFYRENKNVRFMPQNGMKVLVSGRIEVFERDGVYQIYAEEMLASGAGELFLAYEKLKKQLENEGLFRSTRKRKLPKLAMNIGIATSPTGVAVKDLVSIIKRRNPLANIYHVPTVVQGKEGAQSICRSLDILYQMPLDVIIVGRGGGSIEDLWCFNEEMVVRKVAASPIPIISAVGHESDFTLCDFAADVRAATPSMAAELAVPMISELRQMVFRQSELLNVRYQNCVQYKAKMAEKWLSSPILRYPERLLDSYVQRVDRLSEKLTLSGENYVNKKSQLFSLKVAKLEALSPLKVLSRGYSVCQKNEQTITNIAQVGKGDKVKVILPKGALGCVVEERWNSEDGQ